MNGGFEYDQAIIQALNSSMNIVSAIHKIMLKINKTNLAVH